MQAAASICFTAPLPMRVTKSNGSFCPIPRRTPTATSRKAVRLPAMSALATAPDASTFDYSSPNSVFPAEACETIGGDACDVEMFPEVKPAFQAAARAIQPSEEVDREYLDYNEPRTVFPGEACDDLGGEFCEAEYQTGVYKEQLLTK